MIIIVTSGYENIRHIYDKIWYIRNYKPENSKEIDLTELVSSTYENVIENNFNGHEKFAMHGLKLSSAELKELMLDTIFSNLYCDFIVMLQNLDEGKHSTKHEIFMTSIEFNKDLEVDVSQDRKERFRRRMQSNRLNLIKKVKIKSNDKVAFHSPVLIRAFKETLLIPRPNTDIFDISKNYADIFYPLMFDTDEYTSREMIKTWNETIKAHRLWKLNEDNILWILNLADNVLMNNFGGDKVAQMMLLEKLYGINTIADLWEIHVKNDYIDDWTYNLFCAFTSMRRLGYCLLHQYLIESISVKLLEVIRVKDVIDRFIYPVCIKVIEKILKTVLETLDVCGNEKSIDLINKLIKTCDENRKIVFTNAVVDTLLEIPEDALSEFMKGINGIKVTKDSSLDILVQLLGDVELEDEEDMKDYLKTLSSKSYNEQYYDDKYRKINRKLLYDVSFYDLTFTKKYVVTADDAKNILCGNSSDKKKIK